MRREALTVLIAAAIMGSICLAQEATEPVEPEATEAANVEKRFECASYTASGGLVIMANSTCNMGCLQRDCPPGTAPDAKSSQA